MAEWFGAVNFLVATVVCICIMTLKTSSTLRVSDEPDEDHLKALFAELSVMIYSDYGGKPTIWWHCSCPEQRLCFVVQEANGLYRRLFRRVLEDEKGVLCVCDGPNPL